MVANRTNYALIDPVVQFGQVRSRPADFDYLISFDQFHDETREDEI